MNSKRETVEQAIRDLELHKEDLKMVYSSWLSDELEDHRQTMEDLYDERVKITNNLFTGQTPVFKPEDFRSNRGKKPLRYPLIIGKATKKIVRVPRLISRIDLFIKQLETKLSNRKDLQESSPFQLTEAKLKQMILEALEKLS